MSILKISPVLINIQNATDGDVLVYSAANGIVEFGTFETSSDNNAWVNSNDYATYSVVTANAHDSYTTISGLINTVQANLTSVIGAAPSTLDTLAEISAALENDANLAVTLSTQIGSIAANVSSLPDSAANDYSTYSTVTGLIDLVQANVSSLPDSAANDYSTYTTLSGLINTINENVTSGVSSAANDYLTYTTLSGLINTVQSNIESLAIGNTSIISDQITITNSNIFALSQSVFDANNIIVSYNGLIQNPNDDYIVSGTTLTINNTAPLVAGVDIEVRHLSTAGSASAGGSSSTSANTISYVMNFLFGG